MKSFVKIGIILGSALLMTSCFNKSKPNYQYFPNMYEPVGYEAYDASNAFPGGMEALSPVVGTIARGSSLYEFPDTTEGYEDAKANLGSPLDVAEMETTLTKGKELFDIYCAICHGKKGDGQGNLVKREKFLGVPKYDDAARAITIGSVYHVIYYGKNSMGSHAAQLDEKERWQVAEYVMKLKSDLEK